MKQESKARASHGIEEKTRKLELIKSAIAELPDDLPISSLYESCEDLVICSQYEIGIMRQIRNALSTDWHRATSPKNVLGDWMIELRHRRYNLKLTWFATPDGKTCKKVVIGYKQEPQYKIVCGV